MPSKAVEVSTNYHPYFMWVQLTGLFTVTEQCFAALSMCIQALFMVSLRPWKIFKCVTLTLKSFVLLLDLLRALSWQSLWHWLPQSPSGPPSGPLNLPGVFCCCSSWLSWLSCISRSVPLVPRSQSHGPWTWCPNRKGIGKVDDLLFR